MRVRNNLTYGERMRHLDNMFHGKETINEQTYYNYCNKVGLCVRTWTRWF